jgi:hypothetical protein
MSNNFPTLLKFSGYADDNTGNDCNAHSNSVRLGRFGNIVKPGRLGWRWPMKGLLNHQAVRASILALGLLGSVGLTGCQVTTGGQTLPSPYYLDDDVQYFPSGREFKLQREADAQRAANEAQSQTTKRTY